MKVEQVEEDAKSYSIDEAFDYCAAVTSAHYENFPVASMFLPKEQRPYIQAIYAFSRTADDFADEGQFGEDERLARLNDWDEKLQHCYKGNAQHPIFIALRETMEKNDIPITPLRDLLTAFKRDVTQHRYKTFDELLSYCACSANPVGRLVLLTFGYRDESLVRLSDNICTALQLANFWQDVDIDRKKDRLYIPLDEIKTYGYSLEEWNDGIWNDRFVNLMKFQVERTRELFYAGADLPLMVDKDLQLELRLVWFGGMSILKNLDRVHYDVFNQRPVLGNLDKIMILLRGLFIDNLARYGKKRKSWDLT